MNEIKTIYVAFRHIDWNELNGESGYNEIYIVPHFIQLLKNQKCFYLIKTKVYIHPTSIA